MADLFERFAEYAYDNNEHTRIIDLIWEDPDFPWRDTDSMSEFVNEIYGAKRCLEFDMLLHSFDMSMTCSSRSDTAEIEEELGDSDNEEYFKCNTSAQEEVCS